MDELPVVKVAQPSSCSGAQMSLGAPEGSIKVCICHYGDPVIPVQAYYARPKQAFRRTRRVHEQRA